MAHNSAELRGIGDALLAATPAALGHSDAAPHDHSQQRRAHEPHEPLHHGRPEEQQQPAQRSSSRRSGQGPALSAFHFPTETAGPRADAQSHRRSEAIEVGNSTLIGPIAKGRPSVSQSPSASFVTHGSAAGISGGVVGGGNYSHLRTLLPGETPVALSISEAGKRPLELLNTSLRFSHAGLVVTVPDTSVSVSIYYADVETVEVEDAASQLVISTKPYGGGDGPGREYQLTFQTGQALDAAEAVVASRCEEIAQEEALHETERQEQAYLERMRFFQQEGGAPSAAIAVPTSPEQELARQLDREEELLSATRGISSPPLHRPSSSAVTKDDEPQKVSRSVLDRHTRKSGEFEKPIGASFVPRDASAQRGVDYVEAAREFVPAAVPPSGADRGFPAPLGVGHPPEAVPVTEEHKVAPAELMAAFGASRLDSNGPTQTSNAVMTGDTTREHDDRRVQYAAVIDKPVPSCPTPPLWLLQKNQPEIVRRDGLLHTPTTTSTTVSSSQRGVTRQPALFAEAEAKEQRRRLDPSRRHRTVTSHAAAGVTVVSKSGLVNSTHEMHVDNHARGQVSEKKPQDSLALTRRTMNNRSADSFADATRLPSGDGDTTVLRSFVGRSIRGPYETRGDPKFSVCLFDDDAPLDPRNTASSSSKYEQSPSQEGAMAAPSAPTSEDAFDQNVQSPDRSSARDHHALVQSEQPHNHNASEGVLTRPREKSLDRQVSENAASHGGGLPSTNAAGIIPPLRTPMYYAREETIRDICEGRPPPAHEVVQHGYYGFPADLPGATVPPPPENVNPSLYVGSSQSIGVAQKKIAPVIEPSHNSTQRQGSTSHAPQAVPQYSSERRAQTNDGRRSTDQQNEQPPLSPDTPGPKIPFRAPPALRPIEHSDGGAHHARTSSVPHDHHGPPSGSDFNGSVGDSLAGQAASLAPFSAAPSQADQQSVVGGSGGTGQDHAIRSRTESLTSTGPLPPGRRPSAVTIAPAQTLGSANSTNIRPVHDGDTAAEAPQTAGAPAPPPPLEKGTPRSEVAKSARAPAVPRSRMSLKDGAMVAVAAARFARPVDAGKDA